MKKTIAIGLSSLFLLTAGCQSPSTTTSSNEKEVSKQEHNHQEDIPILTEEATISLLNENLSSMSSVLFDFYDAVEWEEWDSKKVDLDLVKESLLSFVTEDFNIEHHKFIVEYYKYIETDAFRFPLPEMLSPEVRLIVEQNNTELHIETIVIGNVMDDIGKELQFDYVFQDGIWKLDKYDWNTIENANLTLEEATIIANSYSDQDDRLLLNEEINVSNSNYYYFVSENDPDYIIAVDPISTYTAQYTPTY